MSARGNATKQVTGLAGTVVRGPFGTGSKSERQAYWLETGEDRLVLKRKNASLTNQRLDKFVGKRVVCDGFIVGYSLLAESIETEK